MRYLLIALLFIQLSNSAFGQSPVGNWKIISQTMIYNGKTIETHTPRVQQKPCVDKIIYEINADGNFLLNASSSGCDASYIKIQEKLYSKTKWKFDGNKISTSSTNFAIEDSYSVSFSGDKMTWVGKEGQGTIVYQKL